MEENPPEIKLVRSNMYGSGQENEKQHLKEIVLILQVKDWDKQNILPDGIKVREPRKEENGDGYCYTLNVFIRKSSKICKLGNPEDASLMSFRDLLHGEVYEYANKLRKNNASYKAFCDDLKTMSERSK